MKIEVELTVESEHVTKRDLEIIAELTKNAWVPRSELAEDLDEFECTMRKTEDGYWQTVVKVKNNKKKK